MAFFAFSFVMPKVLGLGGVFFKAKRPKQLARWYAKWLGLDVEDWGGVRFLARSMPAKGYTVWSPFPSRTDYFRPSRKQFMINFVVDDLDAILERLARSGVKVLKETEQSEFGRFGWFVDPEQNKVELWQPPS
jgi:predicted enzyme related to lactoylglutathione lyase